MPQRGAAQRSAVLSRGTRLDPASPTPRGAHRSRDHTTQSSPPLIAAVAARLAGQPPAAGEALEPSVLHHLGGNAHGGEVRHHLFGREVARNTESNGVSGSMIAANRALRSAHS